MTHAGPGRVSVIRSVAPVSEIEQPAATGAIHRAPGRSSPSQGATSAARPSHTAGAALGAPPSGVGRLSASARP
eukprot:11282334-Alexandrium_andersonii.AAC.1